MLASMTNSLGPHPKSLPVNGEGFQTQFVASTVDVRHASGLVIAFIVLFAIYVSTLQTIPNGSSHYYMIDVGETQIVLNAWGTLHATGYPLYVIMGNILTGLMRLIGVEAVVAPALVSLLWGSITLGLIYALALHVTGRMFLAMGVVILFGLTRTVWIHQVIAEIYTFGLLILVVLLVLGLWRQHIPGRIYWMALLGGIGIAHHRAIAMAIPALLYATWPHLTADRRRIPRMVMISLLLGLLGFIQYGYLYMRARAGAAWVYGEPGTLSGLWAQFAGKEAARFIGLVDSWGAFIDNFNTINEVLIRDLTAPGVMIGIIGLLIGRRSHRREATTMILSGLAAYIFHVLFYSDVLSALILPVTLSLVFGWVFLAEQFVSGTIFTDIPCRGGSRTAPTYAYVIISLIGLLIAVFLLNQNHTFITELTTDPTGLDTIEQVRAAPLDSMVMLAWGPRYFAAGFAHDIDSNLGHITLVDDKADFATIIEDHMLVTPDYTFYNQPIDWWRDRLGADVYLYAVAPHLVQIATRPNIVDDPPAGISIASATVICTEATLALAIEWQTSDRPTEDLSVFVHALDADGNLIAQGDQRAPVYGWRPLTTWVMGEGVRDVYPLGQGTDDITMIRYGLYRVLPQGGFENVLEYEINAICDETSF